MSQPVHYAVHDRVAVITIDNPPVNALGPGVLEGIAAGVARAGIDPEVVASVVIGSGATFIAGADINVFRTLTTPEQSLARSEGSHALLRRIEDAHKPVVAAIHGHALGGGLETAMACHYRVALSSARVGQPEVQLGIIPGAGGTQRLPRLCGAALALEMCTNGRPLSASHARRAGILDFVVDADLLDAAVAFALARAASDGPRPTRYRDEAL
ncbi:MAG: enoyl-CoA hydratase/isomerase family protein, partial [Acidobacteria bacterium]|nr:enoyl-CoA hydratase/isomerase family protein [Acidobacteriota bacterium]